MIHGNACIASSPTGYAVTWIMVNFPRVWILDSDHSSKLADDMKCFSKSSRSPALIAAIILFRSPEDTALEYIACYLLSSRVVLGARCAVRFKIEAFYASSKQMFYLVIGHVLGVSGDPATFIVTFQI
jgi:hypothetical protein